MLGTPYYLQHISTMVVELTFQNPQTPEETLCGQALLWPNHSAPWDRGGGQVPLFFLWGGGGAVQRLNPKP